MLLLVMSFRSCSKFGTRRIFDPSRMIMLVAEIFGLLSCGLAAASAIASIGDLVGAMFNCIVSLFNSVFFTSCPSRAKAV